RLAGGEVVGAADDGRHHDRRDVALAQACGFEVGENLRPDRILLRVAPGDALSLEVRELLDRRILLHEDRGTQRAGDRDETKILVLLALVEIETADRLREFVN